MAGWRPTDDDDDEDAQPPGSDVPTGMDELDEDELDFTEDWEQVEDGDSFVLGERTDSWGRPSAENQDYVTHVEDWGDEYQLSGRWLEGSSSWARVRVPKSPDVPAFFAQDDLPPLFPDAPAWLEDAVECYMEDADDGEERDPEAYARWLLRTEWTNVYLHHPDPQVIIATLGAQIRIDSVGVLNTLAFLLTHGNPEIERAAARAIWARAEHASSWDFLLTVLAGRGSRPSGIDRERAKNAARLLYALCPPDVPATQREHFIDLAKQYFGASVFGPAEMTDEEREAAESIWAVRYSHTYQRPAGMGGVMFIYEMYVAATKAQARAFLETQSVDREFYYIVVETPEGNVGLDIQGMYEE